jgi:lipoprotein NlpD
MNCFSRGSFTALIVAILISCAPVREWNPLDYTVRAGDTLYSIAWRYELDFQEIARWNSITPPYAIFPGQRLSLSADNASGSAGRELIVNTAPAEQPTDTVIAATIETPEPEIVQRAESVVVQKGDTLYSIAQKNGLNSIQIARWNALHSPYTLSTGQTLRLTPPGNRVAISKAATVEKSVPAVVVATPPVDTSTTRAVVKPVDAGRSARLPAVSGWNWPVKGPLLKTFKSDDTSRKGIAISGKSGQTVSAAAAGKVVYSGNGLISYGNLIIIKHDDNFLSAYAHNQALLVTEGDDVKSDQPIARMGQENGRAQLHFEIRKNGKPVNPLQYLPQG